MTTMDNYSLFLFPYFFFVIHTIFGNCQIYLLSFPSRMLATGDQGLSLFPPAVCSALRTVANTLPVLRILLFLRDESALQGTTLDSCSLLGTQGPNPPLQGPVYL